MSLHSIVIFYGLIRYTNNMYQGRVSAPLVRKMPHFKLYLLFFWQLLQTLIWLRMLYLKLGQYKCWTKVVAVWPIPRFSSYVWYQFTMYLWRIFRIIFLSLLQVNCVKIPPPQKLLLRFAHFSLAASSLFLSLNLYIIRYIYGNMAPSYVLTQ